MHSSQIENLVNVTELEEQKSIFDLFYLGEEQRYKAFLINFILYYINLILLDEEHYNSILHLHAF